MSISHRDPGQRSENTHQSRPGHPDIEQLRLNLKLPRSWAGLLTWQLDRAAGTSEDINTDSRSSIAMARLVLLTN